MCIVIGLCAQYWERLGCVGYGVWSATARDVIVPVQRLAYRDWSQIMSTYYIMKPCPSAVGLCKASVCSLLENLCELFTRFAARVSAACFVRPVLQGSTTYAAH